MEPEFRSYLPKIKHKMRKSEITTRCFVEDESDIIPPTSHDTVIANDILEKFYDGNFKDFKA